MEIAAIITGILSILAGMLPGVPAGRRALAILSGAGFALYGAYVLNHDSGTWYFPLYLFLLPLLTAGSAASASLRTTEASEGQPFGRDSMACSDQLLPSGSRK